MLPCFKSFVKDMEFIAACSLNKPFDTENWKKKRFTFYEESFMNMYEAELKQERFPNWQDNLPYL